MNIILCVELRRHILDPSKPIPNWSKMKNPLNSYLFGFELNSKFGWGENDLKPFSNKDKMDPNRISNLIRIRTDKNFMGFAFLTARLCTHLFFNVPIRCGIVQHFRKNIAVYTPPPSLPPSPPRLSTYIIYLIFIEKKSKQK